jgi:hypothetical protein
MASVAEAGAGGGAAGGPAGRASSTPLPVLVLAMALVIVPLIALSQFIAYWRTDVVDDQMFGYYGWRIVHGARVYLDVWDNKPPGIYWINALGMLLGGGNYLGVVAVCAAALVVAHVAFFVAASSVYKRDAAAVTTVLLGFYLMHAYYTGGTNRTETFLVACELAAVAFYLRGCARDRWWKWYAAGILCGAAFLFKQVGLAAWGCMGLHTILLVCTRELRVAAGVKRGLLLLGGAATTVGLAGVVLAREGALGAALFATFAFNRAYFVTGDAAFPYNYASMKLMEDHLLPIMLLPLLMATAAAVHALLWWLRPQYRPAEIEAPLRAAAPVCRASFALFGVWFVAAFWGAVLSPSRFRHYLVPAIPPLMLAAGYLVNVLLAEGSLLRRLQQRAWVTAAFVIMGYFAWGALVEQFREVSKVLEFRFEQHEQAEWEAVGDAVVRHSGPQDKLQCMGYMPGVYLRARRLNATRFTTTEKVGQVRAEARFVVTELEESLRRDPPALLAMPFGDYAWMRDGADRNGRPSDFHLHAWLLEYYQLVEEVPKYGTVYIFKRRDLLDPARDPDLSAQLPPRPAKP